MNQKVGVQGAETVPMSCISSHKVVGGSVCLYVCLFIYLVGSGILGTPEIPFAVNIAGSKSRTG